MNILRLFVASAVVSILSVPAYSSIGSNEEERICLQNTSPAIERPGTFKFKKMKPIDYAQEKALVSMANEGYIEAQDEVLYRMISDILSRNIQETVEFKSWAYFQHRAKSTDIYCFAALAMIDSEMLKIVYPDIISDLEKRVLQNDTFALTMLAFAYERGSVVVKDLKKSKGMLKKAADQGSAIACALLSHRYESGNNTKGSDFVKSFQFKLKAANQGLPSMLFDVAQAYNGVTANKYQINENPIKALLHYMVAAQYGHFNASQSVKMRLALNQEAQQSSGSFKENVQKLLQPVSELTSHCERKLILNNAESKYKEAKFALPVLAQLYKPIFEFGDLLSSALKALESAREGFDVDCVRLDLNSCKLVEGFVSDELAVNMNNLTFGAHNVMVLKAFEAYMNRSMSEFRKVNKVLKTLINSLYPPHASLHACQQAAISGDENAVVRFEQELAEYNEILSINQTEIKILTEFKDSLGQLQTKLWGLLGSTRGMRNREFLEEFSFLKG